MGLDMYFSVRHREYKSFNRFDQENDLNDTLCYPKNLEAFIPDLMTNSGKGIYTTVEYSIGYFRKFNALHCYIVENFADGEDTCQDIPLRKKNIEKLLLTLKDVIDDPEDAPNTLPCGKGFFFGSQDYDEWYFSDVNKAINLFTKILENVDFDNETIIYRASW